MLSASVRERLEEEITLGQLIAEGIVLDGHFDHGNGYHSMNYLCAQPLLEDPYAILQYAEQMAGLIPSETLKCVDLVTGIITGGAIIGPMLAIAIDRQRGPGEKRVKFAPVYKVDGKLRLRDHYRKLIAGPFGKDESLNVLGVDDVCNTGKTLRGMRSLVEDCGGHWLGSTVLYDRQATLEHLINHYPLQHVQADPTLVEADKCICQKVKMTVTKF